MKKIMLVKSKAQCTVWLCYYYCYYTIVLFMNKAMMSFHSVVIFMNTTMSFHFNHEGPLAHNAMVSWSYTIAGAHPHPRHNEGYLAPTKFSLVLIY